MVLVYEAAGTTDEEATIDRMLSRLKADHIVPEDAEYSRNGFAALRAEVRNTFEIPDTMVTPVMERLLYMLSSVRKPKRILGIGIFCGNTLVWNVGSSCGAGRIYQAEWCLGVDIDREASGLAGRNFSHLDHTEHVQIMTEDGLRIAEKLSEPVDYLYLDADDRVHRKGLYIKMLSALYPKLQRGAWVLAHDTAYAGAGFPEQLREYLRFVRDPTNFEVSISFKIDDYGLELSIK